MNSLPAFKENSELTIGVELELQLVNLHDFNLTMEAQDYLRRLEQRPHPGLVKPEITQSMIELNSSIHISYASLLAELRQLRKIMSDEARKAHLGISGGGTHPFQKWKQQRIFQTERFASLAEQYGYLAKQFTVFGQHIHLACANGDDALYLCHAMARFLPQFVALSSASPFNQGVDTAYDCSRLAVVSAFPLSGTPPWVLTWAEFDEYYKNMLDLGVITNIKDFYWDIRPKPEFGTIEIRICDTPLTVEKAAELAAYAQMLTRWLLDERPPLTQEVYLTYPMNRFRATRYGMEATIIDPVVRSQVLLADDILATCAKLRCYAHSSDNAEALMLITEAVTKRQNGASWLRACYGELHSLSDTVRAQSELWMNERSL